MTVSTRIFVAPPELIGDPEITAMLQAFYSRSHKGIEERLTELTDGKTDPEAIRESLKKWYINYNHDSIGDCGNILVFIENVPMYVAKAIQDNPLYNGQETSSRFIDFGSQDVWSDLPEEYLDDHLYWMGEYRWAVDYLKRTLGDMYRDLTEAQLAPMVFDIGRGLLPVTALTNLSWFGSIRTFRNHIAQMYNHPNDMVKEAASDIHSALQEAYPNLFTELPKQSHLPQHDWFIEAGDRDLIDNLSVVMEGAPAELPGLRHMRALGTYPFFDNMDYGSYRDIQRQRRSYVKSQDPFNVRTESDGVMMPFHVWYLKHFPLEKIEEWCGGENGHVVPPLMINVLTLMVSDLEQLAYVTRLRTAPTVHPTAREFATSQAEEVVYSRPFPNVGTLLNINREPSNYVKRATQTINKKVN